MKIIKRIIIIIVILVVISLIIYGLIPKPVECEVGRATVGDIVVSVAEDGKTRVRDRYTVYAPQQGSISRIKWKAGDEVKTGTVLTVVAPVESPLLDDRARRKAKARVKAGEALKMQAEAEVKRAKDANELALRELKRAQKLITSGAITKRELDIAVTEESRTRRALESAKFTLKVAGHELNVAKAALSRFPTKSNPNPETEKIVIKSPVKGRILRVFRESAGIVMPGEKLLEIGDPSSIEIIADFLTTEAVKIKEGAPAYIVNWGGNSKLPARVRRIEPSGFTKVSALGVEEQRVNVLLDPIKIKNWPPLADGYHVEVQIEVAKKKNVLKIPTSSLFRHSEQWAVYIVTDNKAELKEIKVGLKNSLEAEIVSGIEKATKVILYPSDKIKPGIKIQIP